MTQTAQNSIAKAIEQRLKLSLFQINGSSRVFDVFFMKSNSSERNTIGNIIVIVLWLTHLALLRLQVMVILISVQSLAQTVISLTGGLLNGMKARALDDLPPTLWGAFQDDKCFNHKP